MQSPFSPPEIPVAVEYADVMPFITVVPKAASTSALAVRLDEAVTVRAPSLRIPFAPAPPEIPTDRESAVRASFAPLVPPKVKPDAFRVRVEEDSATRVAAFQILSSPAPPSMPTACETPPDITDPDEVPKAA